MDNAAKISAQRLFLRSGLGIAGLRTSTASTTEHVYRFIQVSVEFHDSYSVRQDRYLKADSAPFLIIHWKHELSAIRMLDLIPGDGTLLVEQVIAR